MIYLRYKTKKKKRETKRSSLIAAISQRSSFPAVFDRDVSRMQIVSRTKLYATLEDARFMLFTKREYKTAGGEKERERKNRLLDYISIM